MSMSIYYSLLVLHVIGITVMAGTTFIDFITFRVFWKTMGTDWAKSLLLEDYLYKLQRFLGIGMLLILISGIGMMVKLHEVWGAQLWFRIKMGILLIIIVNGLGLRRQLGASLKKLLSTSAGVKADLSGWAALNRKFTAVQVLQMLLFISIYILSVFKFN